MVTLHEQEILVITPLFPDPKYDILIMISVKTDFYAPKCEFDLLLE